MPTIETFNDRVFDDVKAWLEDKFSDRKDLDDACIVVALCKTNMYPEAYRSTHPHKRVIVYNLEQMFPGATCANPFYLDWLRKADDVWDYDIDNINFLATFGIKAKYMPLEYTPALKYNTKAPEVKDIDVLFYGMLTPRRLQILQAWSTMSHRHAKTVILTGVFGDDLIPYIQRSKIVLNLHAYPNSARQEQVRLAPLLVNNVCVVSEDSTHNEFGQSLVTTDTRNINKTLKNLLKTDAWKQVAANSADAYRAYCACRGY